MHLNSWMLICLVCQVTEPSLFVSSCLSLPYHILLYVVGRGAKLEIGVIGTCLCHPPTSSLHFTVPI